MPPTIAVKLHYNVCPGHSRRHCGQISMELLSTKETVTVLFKVAGSLFLQRDLAVDFFPHIIVKYFKGITNYIPAAEITKTDNLKPEQITPKLSARPDTKVNETVFVFVILVN